MMETRKSTRMKTRISKSTSYYRTRPNKKAGLVDRMSDLPDSILCVILSCLPTKDAVATSILSKRWYSVWMSVYNLDFSYNNSNNNMDGFVGRIIELHGCKPLNKFRLVREPMFLKASQYTSWKKITLMTTVHDLFLLFDIRLPQPFDLPISLFTCESLQSLELGNNIYVSPSVVFSLPRLLTLKLVSVYFHSEENVEKLIKGCPMLLFLHLDCRFTKGFEEEDVITYRISSPTLRHLHLHDSRRLHQFDLRGEDSLEFELFRSLELEASSLEYIQLYGHINQVTVQGTLSSLVEAHFDIDLQEYFDSRELCTPLAEGVRSFDSAKALSLSVDAMWALNYSPIYLSTKFTRLTKLKADVACCYCSSLMDFILNSDSLQLLTIRKVIISDYYDDYEDDEHDHSNWNADIPNCLSNSLKDVSFQSYAGCDDERGMIAYLLKHASSLEVMQITYDEDNLKAEKYQLAKDICRLPRKSPACKVQFIK